MKKSWLNGSICHLWLQTDFHMSSAKRISIPLDESDMGIPPHFLEWFAFHLPTHLFVPSNSRPEAREAQFQFVPNPADWEPSRWASVPSFLTCIHAHSIQNTYRDFGYIERNRPAMNISQMGRSCREGQWDLRYRGLGWGSFRVVVSVRCETMRSPVPFLYCASSSCHACPFLFSVFLVLLFPFLFCIVPVLSCEFRRDDKRWQETRRDEKRWDCTHLSHFSLFVSPVILFFAAFQPLLPE